TSLIEMADQVMTPVDREMAGFAHAEIREKGVDLKLGVALESVKFVPNEHVASFDSGESEKHQHLEGELELTLNNGEKLTT
ncbi:CoA-disulfide reductase, partial [Vibrio sp. Vb0592]|nr:CoA-disulfide reductase [Vibrio sp. Vb0592]